MMTAQTRQGFVLFFLSEKNEYVMIEVIFNN